MGLAEFFFLEDNEASWQVYCSLLLNIETKRKKIYIVYVIKVTRHFLPIPPPPQLTNPEQQQSHRSTKTHKKYFHN